MDVAVVKGVVRYDNIFKALELLEEDIQRKVSQSSRIVIKPDLLHINNCADLTNVDAVKAVLDFIEEYTNKKITIAEGSFSTEDVFYKHGYHDLLRDYSVRFFNLNDDDSIPVKIGKSSFNVSKTLLEADYRISVSVLKQDTKAVLMGAIPNLIVGSISDSDKANFYKSRFFNRNIAELSKLLHPNLSVVDGANIKTIRKLKTSLAIASTDAIAADITAAKILGIKKNTYLTYSAKRKIKLLK